MKILFISLYGSSVALGLRLKNEGHSVRFWIKDEKEKGVGNGFVEKVPSWEASKSWADLIVTDDGRFGKVAESLKKEGKPVWGGDPWSDDLEESRKMGQETLKTAGMTIIPFKEFSGLAEAISFVKTNPKRYVAKPSGPIQDEKALTYVGKEDDGSDMVSILEQYKETWGSKINQIQLQEFKKGIEVAVSGFFNGKEFLDPIFVNFEHKKIMAGDIGPGSGEMGTAAVWMRKNRIYRESIGRCVNLLKDHRYVGYIDINCIATEKNLYPLEFTTRFGYPTLQLQLETIKGNIGDWLFRVARGEKANPQLSNPYSVCVVVATPPFPFLSDEIYKHYGQGQQVLFRTKDRSGVWPGDICEDKGRWFVEGVSGFSLVCTGQGKKLDEAREMAYSRVEKFTLPNAFWRNDIAMKTDGHLKDLNKWGWFRD